MSTDFFDGPFKAEAEKEEISSKPATMADVLPEGFFDDPKMDAKASFFPSLHGRNFYSSLRRRHFSSLHERPHCLGGVFPRCMGMN